MELDAIEVKNDEISILFLANGNEIKLLEKEAKLSGLELKSINGLSFSSLEFPGIELVFYEKEKIGIE